MFSNKLLSNSVHMLSALHCILTIIGCFASAFLFPLWAENFLSLDMVRSYSIPSLGIMALSDNSEYLQIGFVNSSNCTVYFFVSFFIIVAFIIISILMFFKRKFAPMFILWVYGADILFLLYHWLVWPDMLNIAAMPNYAICSLLYKAIGMVLMLIHLRTAPK